MLAVKGLYISNVVLLYRVIAWPQETQYQGQFRRRYLKQTEYDDFYVCARIDAL